MRNCRRKSSSLEIHYILLTPTIVFVCYADVYCWKKRGHSLKNVVVVVSTAAFLVAGLLLFTLALIVVVFLLEYGTNVFSVSKLIFFYVK